MNAKEEQKQRSREAILASAACLLRERGIKASSVLEVMKGAGLTVGGFYGHFDSKEELFVATLRHAARAPWQRLLASATGESSREKALSVARKYLSRKHRDRVEEGCLLPSVTAEIAQEGEPYRAALAEELLGFVRSLGEMLGESDEAREEAYALIALMYGALSLSRALAGTPASEVFLRSAKRMAEKVLLPAASSASSTKGV